MANPYSIHLVEPLSPEVAQRVANETASQLGGTPDKLAQLLTRNSGSRIARASSAAQADRVAGILRKAGVTVQVVDPETIENVVPGAQNLESAAKNSAQSQILPNSTPVPLADHQVKVEASNIPETPISNYDVNAGSSSSSSGGTPIVPDEIIPVDEAPYVPPIASQSPPSMSDLFPVMNSSIAPPSDPFATDSKDLFKPDSVSQNPVSASDPFAAPTRGTSNAPENDPFAAPKNDPFAEPFRNDPFAAPASNSFAASSAQDPFAPAAGVVNSNPETPPAFDPFAASQVPAAVSELPTQALKAQNRSLRRSSINSQMLRSLIAPILLTALLTGVYLNYQIPITMQGFLTAQAKTSSSILSAQLISVIANSDRQTIKGQLDNMVSQTRYAVPNAKFVAVSTESNSNKVLSSSVDTELDPKKLIAKLDSQQLQTNSGTVIEIDGNNYVTYKEPIKNAIGQPLGTVYTGIDYRVINDEKLKLFIPLFIALLLIVLGASVVAAAFANRLVRPIVAAAEQANRISLGDLERTVEIESNDEVGDLLNSLERMRVSLKSVIGRLRRDR